MTSPDPLGPPSTTDWPALKGAVRRFEDAWRHGSRPAIDDHLPADQSQRRRLLVELVHIDLELRLKAGEPARVEEYLVRYPELADNRSAVLQLIAAEHELRRRVTPDLSLEEYLQRFPEFRDELPVHIAAPTEFCDGPARDTPQRRGSQSPEPPPEVPGYEILGPLGRGGMGVVYKARQLNLDRPVALKFLPEDCARDPAWFERFRREAVTASALNHPHICTIHDTGEVAGRPYLSMEFIEGQTLAALIARRPPVRELARLFRQAAAALAAAAAAGVVHRDVKPENLMVRDDGILKVLDFGLARRVASEPGERRRPGVETEPGVRVGTVLYMSPEQARGEPVGPASDVFSLGLVLYELATGRHPFLAESEIEVLLAITSQTAIPPERLNPEIVAPLASLIERMLAKEPQLRPTAAEVEADLAAMEGNLLHAEAAPAPDTSRPAVVGREREIATLREAFAAAAAGRANLVCVTGEPGLGKTSTVEHFLAGLNAAGRVCGIARGRCSERLAGSEAYLPWFEALDSLLRGEDGATHARILKTVAPTWYVHVAPAGSDESLERLAEQAKTSSGERMKRELVAFFREASRVRPLVVVLDDLHWADASTVDLLAYLGGRGEGLRVLSLITYRPTEMLLGQHPFLPVQLELQRHGVCREVSLNFLGRDAVVEYLARTFPGHDFPTEFVELVRARTEGNPLFLVDLLRYLRDRSVIAPGPRGWTLTQAPSKFRDEMPESVRSMVRKKIALLRKGDLRLLSAASVQGCEFDSAVLCRVLGLDPARAEERLAALDRVHGLVRTGPEQEFPAGTPTVRCRFVHVLYQNALYGALQPSRRAAWSGAIARTLLEMHGDKAPAAANELAMLFETAREPEAAVPQFLQAAHNALRVFAHREAIALARRGIAQLQKLPETPARDRQELALLHVLGVSLIAASGFASPEAETTFGRARTLCQRGEDVPTLFPVLYGLWNVYLVRCELARCLELATQMHDQAIGLADPVLRLQAHNVLQQPLFHLGDLTAARRHQEEALALYDQCRHHTLTAVYGEDPGVGCHLYRAMTLWHLGYPDQALQSALAARRLAEELRNPFNVARALYFGATIHLYRREVTPCKETAAALTELCREQDFAQLVHGGTTLRGWALTREGRTEEGIALMREGLAGWLGTGASSHRPYLLTVLADALGTVGRVDEGLACLDEASALTEKTGERFSEAELHRVRGELMRSKSDAGGAEACFHTALAVARRQEAKLPELRAALGLGRLLRQRGQDDEARRLVRDVSDWFTEGRDTADLQDARAFLEDRT